MKPAEVFSSKVLELDAPRAVERIAEKIGEIVNSVLRRKGAVVGLSGGIDSSVTAALCVRALGKDRVFGIMMPDQDSSSDSLRLGNLLKDSLGISTTVEDLSPSLQALGCYSRRDDAIRLVIPEYGERWKSKIVLPDLVGGSRYALFSVTAQSPDGTMVTVRLSPEAYLGIVAATNFKQRTRKMFEYYHADRLWYAVAGTPNRLEYAQGFFVKNGDGSADFKPIAHLYKTQVYQLAEYLGVPEEIRSRPPTTDTYSLEQSQQEFFFALPLRQLDLCLYAKDHGLSAEEAAAGVELSAEQVTRVYTIIDSRLRSARYLHFQPQLIEPVNEVGNASSP